jgi:hypothetical protein
VSRPRPTYRTFVIERHLAVPRDDAWQALLELLEGAGHERTGTPPPHGVGARIRFTLDSTEMVEETLSFEPPWRRVYEMVEGAPVALYQGTTAIRDDGPECHLVWSYLVDPGDLPEPELDAFLDRVQTALHRAVDRIAQRLAAAR